ncbi:bifunctional DNA-formamidopyrimidine glycosylase/DNA-(apurinic or apyrimidinic site) lyase [Cohaesibacter gelatinilyticus]|uniref:Formamidopyrimidine-DNA glycosylase n=1 Tax=Cohaesibacter gelatinilyticus TaxID=372072 RepID=A0A285PE56_9HYPH|nr:bifunctional DNA-formamidopyrimidine glycosylase/DNA-(apurinic or apyrimidinic site) lyase [Cohaesibacter gelatinilyticus]SNZ20009.1 DNA-(apurinic or apyrimidinic site) lyase [Cohaesibacter gelatinilyticus]
MPELPEVETVRSGLAPFMEGETIEKAEVRRPNLRFDFPHLMAERLKGREITSLGRRSKYLLADLDDGQVLVIHLGMSGSFRVIEKGEAHLIADEAFHIERGKRPKHDHVVLHMSNGAVILYNDPRRFGFFDLIARSELADHAYFAKMGVEPVGNELSADHLAPLFASRKAPLKAVLLDQHVIAGLGNIYVCEALHRSGLDPRKPARELVTKSGKPSKKLELLTDEIRATIAEAIKAGGSTLKDHTKADGTLGYFQHSFKTYDREGEPCNKEGCKGSIERIVQSGRSTFFCSSCQK